MQDKLRSGYGFVTDWSERGEDGNLYCFLDCEDSGSKDCCWSIIKLAIRGKSSVVYEWKDIQDFVHSQVKNNVLQGEIAYFDDLPLSWNFTADGAGTITIESTQD